MYLDNHHNVAFVQPSSGIMFAILIHNANTEILKPLDGKKNSTKNTKNVVVTQE